MRAGRGSDREGGGAKSGDLVRASSVARLAGSATRPEVTGAAGALSGSDAAATDWTPATLGQDRGELDVDGLTYAPATEEAAAYPQRTAANHPQRHLRAQSKRKKSAYVLHQDTPPRVLLNLADAFYDAAAGGRYAEVRSRLEGGQDVDCLHSFLLVSALHGSVDQGQRRVTRLLLDSGANPDIASGITGQTALHRAAARGDPQLIRMLLNAGAHRKHASHDGRIPLQLAAEYQWEDAMNMLRDVPCQPLVIRCSVEAHSIRVDWDPPPDNGTAIDRYELYWKPRREQSAYCRGKDPITKMMYWHHRQTHEVLWGKPDEGGQAIGEGGDPVGEGEDYPLAVGGKDYNPEWNKVLDLQATEWMLTDLPPSNIYYVIFRAHSAAGFSEFSRALELRTNDLPPSPPLRVRLSAATARMLSINWDPPVLDNGGHVQFYEVQTRRVRLAAPASAAAASPDQGRSAGMPSPAGLAQDEPEAWKVVNEKLDAELEPNTRSVKLQPSTLYEFRVRAWNKEGWSTWSATSPPLSTTTACSVVHSTARTLSVMWVWDDGEDPVLGYELQIFHVPVIDPRDETFRGIADSVELCDRLGIRANKLATLEWITVSSTLQQKRFTVKSLTPNHEYAFRVRTNYKSTGWTSWDDSGESSVARTLQDKPERPEPPIFDGIECFDRLSWRWVAPIDNGSPITTWKIWYRPADSDSEEETGWTLARGDLSEMRCTVETLKFGVEYEFAVAAQNKIGVSDRSEASVGKFTRALEPPVPPIVIENADSTAKIQWVPPHVTGMPVDKYELQYRSWRLVGGVDTASGWEMIARPEALVYLVTGLPPTLSFEFRILAHTYAAVPDAQWSMPSKPSERVRLKRRL